MKKVKILAPLAVMIVAIGLVLFWYLGKGEASKQGYKIETMKKGKIAAVVSSTGSITPINTVKVGSQVSGIIKEINVDFNSVVTKDQVLARIDTSIYAAQVAQSQALLLRARTQILQNERDIEAANANVSSAQAGITSAKATLHEAELNYDRLSKLAERQIIAKSEFDAIIAKKENAAAALEVAAAKLETAQAQVNGLKAAKKGFEAIVKERQAALQLDEVRLKYCTIISPINGVVVERAVDVGQTVAATLASPTLFTVAEDLTRMQVEVDVSESDVGQIQPEQKVEFTVDAFPDRKFAATVRQVRNSPTSIQNVVTYKVIADVQNNDLALRPGMTANVTIVYAEEEEVLKLPNSALRFRPLGQVNAAPAAGAAGMGAAGGSSDQPRKTPPVKERDMYKNAVEKIKLDGEQAQAFAKIIETADGKLRGVLAVAQDDKARREAFRPYLTEIYKGLRELLRQDQVKPYARHMRELQKGWADMRKNKGKPGTVYVVDKDGKPKEVKIVIGISNETETQYVSGPLKEGDAVITGLSMNGGQKGKSSANPLMRIFGGGGRP